MPEIAYLTTSPLPSEKANMLQSIEVARSLCRAGWKVDFFCPKAEQELSDGETVSKAREFYGGEFPFEIKLIKRLVLHGRYSALLTVPSLVKKALSEKDYDYYYVRNPYLLSALVLLGRHVVFEQHQWNSYKAAWKNGLIRYMTLRAGMSQNCKLFVCISEELRRRWMDKGLAPSKTMTAHDAVDIELFTPVISRREARIKLGLPEGKTIVSYVGSLYGNRAIRDILWVASEMQEVDFRLIGGPETQKRKYEEFVRRSGTGNVQFTGRVSRANIPVNLFASDILLFTMNEETLTYDVCSPMKIFEYLAAERVIVAPNLPSLREVLGDDFSFLYVFGSKHSLLQKIIAAVHAVESDAGMRYGRRGRSILREKYTWQKRTDLILNTLQVGRREIVGTSL